MTWQKKAQFVTVDQAIQKLEKYCAYQERSQKHVKEKCRNLGLTESETGEVMIHLLQRDFLNESRFAFAYVRGKSKVKSWGVQKIRQGLKLAGISDTLIQKSLEQLEDSTTDVQIGKWSRKKLKQLGFKEEEIEAVFNGSRKISYEEKQKIKIFLYQKGFVIERINATLSFLK